MLVNLSDVLAFEGMQARKSADLEMTGFESRIGSFGILEKSPVSFLFTNIEEGKARVQGSVRLKFRAECDRCLAEVPVTMNLDFDRIVAAPDVSAEETDDLGFMEGYQLNVDAFVRDEIIGNWPAKILCREDCKGICPSCGQDLNIRDCGCDTFVPDPRMAAIQDIFNSNGK